MADQLDTQQLLTVSLDVLAHFYGRNQATTKVRVVWNAEIEDDGCWKGLDIEDDGENKRLEEIKAMFRPKIMLMKVVTGWSAWQAKDEINT